MKIKNILYILIPAILLFGCKKQNFTGMSDLTPTNPTITVNVGTPLTYIDGVDQSHKITLTMSVAQVVDVKVWITVKSGATATEGEDFSVPASIVIPAGRTKASFNVKILKDDAYEPTEYFTITIGDKRTANAKITPVDAKFTIQNFVSGDLALKLAWDPQADDQYGDPIAATDIADMIFYIKKPNGLVDTVDGAGFEGYVIPDTAADGNYLVYTQFYNAMQFPDPVDLNLSLSTYEVGMVDNTLEYPGLATTADASMCEFNLYLASIVKAGKQYTITKTPARIVGNFNLSDFAGNYTGAEYGVYKGTKYGGNVSLTDSLCATNDTIYAKYLGLKVMPVFWGENPVDVAPTYLIIKNDGTIDIPMQYLMTTTAAGGLADSVYNISGNGTYSSCDQSMVLHYEISYASDGSGIAAAWGMPYFVEDISHAKKSSTIQFAPPFSRSLIPNKH